MKLIRSFLISVLVLVSLGLAGVVGYVFWASQQPIVSGSDSYTIKPGTGVKQVAANLVAEGILEEPYTFTAWAYYREYTARIHAGEYFIRAGQSVEDLLELFVSGRVIQRSVTLIEGWTFRDFLRSLRAAKKLRNETRDLDAEEIMNRLGVPDKQPEGWFFPDTYNYTADMSDIDVLRRAHAVMRRVLDEEWRNRKTKELIENEYQALVLASIIEKETGRKDERTTIAAVFHNRLRKGMRLQTDPTVIYGLGEEFDGNLTRAHLKTDTPYNTYTRAGLPPTPIAMPGRASINAALNPSASEALYFVSRGDGSHVFSNSLQEHNNAVYRYQIRGGQKAESDADEAKSGEQQQ